MKMYLRKAHLLTLFVLSFCLVSRAQTNLFTTANIAATTFSPTPSYGTATNLYDGSTGTYVYWGVTTSNITVQLKQAAKLVYYTSIFYSTSYLPQTVAISGSNDNINWVQLDSRSVGSATTFSAAFNNANNYTYYKFTYTGLGSAGLMVVTELRGYASVPAPTTPTLTASAASIGTYASLSWTSTVSANPSVSAGYEIQRSADGTNFSLLASVAAPTTTYRDTPTVQNTAYWYRIRARYDTLFSQYSTAVKITTANDTLKTASTLTAGIRAQYIVPLSWSNIMNTAGSYQLYKSADAVNYTLLKTLDKSITSYSDTLTDTTKNTYYQVRGVNYLSSSPYSNVVKITDSLLSIPGITLSAGIIGTVAQVSWTFVATSSTYQFNVERSTDSVTFSRVVTLAKNILSYSDSSVKNATRYFYRINATNQLGASPYSIIKGVTTVNDSLQSAPVLTASASTGTVAQLSWTYTFRTPTVGGFEIQRSIDGTNFVSLGKVDKTVTSFAVQSLSPNTKYWFRVRAYNYLGSSAFSNLPTVTTNNISATADITYDGGKLFVNAENSGGVTADEGSPKLIDHDISTKFLVFTTQLTGTLNCIYKPTGQYIVTSYGIGTAGDAPARDPKTWTFAGSNDSTNWVTLDSRTDQLGGTTPRTSYFYYNISNPGTVAYKYYRISISANNGAVDGVRFQIAEWPIYGTPTSAPNLPQALKVTDSTASSLSLSWTQDVTDTSKHLTNFILQRGLDQLNFTTVNSKIPASTRTFVDQGLLDSTVYYYRIQAVDSAKSVYTGWSSVASGMTKVTPGIPHVPVLSLGAVTDSTIAFSWVNRANNATGFKIERSSDGVNFTQIDSVSSSVTSYVNYPVWAAYNYYYRVRAFNGNGNSGYSNVISTTTTGYNRAPIAKNPIIYRKVCVGTGKFSFSFDGIVPGPNFELSQTLRVTSVMADTAYRKLFTAFDFNSAVVNGVVNYSFTTSNIVANGDTANILVTVKDNGGILNAGTDSLVIPVKIYFNTLGVSIAANKDIASVPRYALVTLTASSTAPDVTTYKWTSTHQENVVGATNLLLLQVRPLQTETITLTATTPQNCSATASVVLKPQDSLVVSNILTPNGDGINDRWIIYGIQNVNSNNVKVVDRSGRVVFTQNNYSNGWDGRYNGSYLPEGAYYYVVEYTLPAANGGTSKVQSKGVLTIISGR